MQLAKLKLGAPQLSRVGLELKAVLARFERPFSLEFNLTNNPASRGPDQRALKDCLESTSDARDKATCRIAADALQLVISVQPN